MYGRDIKFFAGRPYKKSTSVRIDSASSPRLPLKLRAEDCEFQKCRCPMLSVPAPRERKSDGRMPFEGSGARYATVSFDSKVPPDMPNSSLLRPSSHCEVRCRQCFRPYMYHANQSRLLQK